MANNLGAELKILSIPDSNSFTGFVHSGSNGLDIQFGCQYIFARFANAVQIFKNLDQNFHVYGL